MTLTEAGAQLGLSPATRCEGRIYERPQFIRWHRCNRPAVGERQGHPTCRRHLATKYAPYWVRPGEGDQGAG